MNTDLVAGGQKLKSYWNRPGGKFGTVVGLAALGWIGWKVVPILTTIVWNYVNFGIAAATALVLTYALSHRTLRLSLFYAYEILMKKLAGVVIQMDPFVISEDLIESMHKDREKLLRKTVELEGQKESANATIKGWEKERAAEANVALRAREAGNALAAGNAERQVGRLTGFIENFKPLRNDLEKLSTKLQQIYDRSFYTIEDAEKQLQSQRAYYNAMTTGRNAIFSALQIFKGDPEKKLLAQQSMDFLKEDLALKRADIRLAMKTTDEFVNKIDLTNATYEAQGIEVIEQLAMAENFQLNTTGSGRGVAPVIKAPANEYADLLK